MYNNKITLKFSFILYGFGDWSVKKVARVWSLTAFYEIVKKKNLVLFDENQFSYNFLGFRKEKKKKEREEMKE